MDSPRGRDPVVMVSKLNSLPRKNSSASTGLSSLAPMPCAARTSSS